MRPFAVAALVASLVLAAGGDVYAQQQLSPRELWPQATTAARENDFKGADEQISAMSAAAKAYGIKTFPQYASAAAGMASESATSDPELAKWAARASTQLDGRSPAVAFSEADRAMRANDWAGAFKLAAGGFAKLAGNYRSRVLSRADLIIVAGIAIGVTALLLAIALFIRYGRSMAHDFREVLGAWVSGGTVSVLAFALLFLPVFLWLGPTWLVFYWLAIFFGYAGAGERLAIVLLLLLVALTPIAIDWSAHSAAAVDSPVVLAAISSEAQAYNPEALRRLQELIAVVPDHPTLHVLIGNLQVFEGLDDQASVHYRRAIELRPRYAGAHVNLGNLFAFNNEWSAATSEYEKAQAADPKLPTAFYNHSVAAGETYNYRLQGTMLEKARSVDSSFVERYTRTPPSQKVVMYSPPISEAWAVTEEMSKRPAARALFGNYSSFDPVTTASNPLTIGALVALLLAFLLWSLRRRTGFANACIKCGRTFCHRCKSSRESTTYCTQCIHIYLKRDGVSLDTKRKKLEEVGEHHAAMVRRNKLFATFLPGSAQMLEGRTTSGMIGVFLFSLFVATAILVGRLAPALGPAADVAQLIVRAGAVVVAILIWLTLSLPVYRRRSAA
jgi:tetratricopeptide (TPR) repeat protein